MPQPSASQMHVDRWLTNLSVAYMQDKSAFIASSVFPTVPVVNKSDDILIYPKGAFYRAGQVKPRAQGATPVQAGYAVTQGHYSCQEYALETYFLTEQALINQETYWVNNFFNSGVWSTAVSGATSPTGTQFLQWDQESSSVYADPLLQIRTLMNTARGLTGYKPNSAVFGATAFEGFINNPQVRDRYKFTQGGVIDEAVVASALGIKNVYVAAGVSNTAAEGQADNINYIANPNDVLLCYAAPSPGLRTPSAGYQFAWTGLLPGVDQAYGGVIERGREERAHSDWIQVRQSFDMEVLAPDLGIFLSNCVSSSFGIGTE
jgi:hypothetical protein